MPTYVYACDTCGKQFEKFQSFKEAPLDTCPCGEQSKAVRRVFQPVGIVFKGSGWYVTDNRTSSDASSSSTTNTTSDQGTKGDTSDTSAKSASPSPASAE